MTGLEGGAPEWTSSPGSGTSSNAGPAGPEYPWVVAGLLVALITLTVAIVLIVASTPAGCP